MYRLVSPTRIRAVLSQLPTKRGIMTPSISIADLQRIQAEDLSKMLLDEKADDVVVVDVRDSDYIGGHIKGSHHYASSSLDATMPSLMRKLENKPIVVFHCALSQQRGPAAALKYLRAKHEQVQVQVQAAKKKKQGASLETQEEKTREEEEEDKEMGEKGGKKEQTVYLLDRGFVRWQSLYGRDKRLTEGWRREIWEEEG